MTTTTAPGLHIGMSNADYHATEAMNASGLKQLKRSPAHYYGLMLDPNRPPQSPPSAAMLNGTLVHCALFEPAELEARYVIKPAGMTFTTKDGKAWRDAQTADIVDAEQMAAAKAQAASVRSLPDLDALLAEGKPEVSAFWTDEDTGVLCKCRPDWVAPAGDGVVLVDGKTCIDASPEGFAKSIWNYGYHLQAAWYSDGYERATGLRVHGFVFAAVENTWPYLSAAYMLGDDVLDRARADNRRLLNLYAECRRSGKWPGYAGQISLIQLPVWAQRLLMESN